MALHRADGADWNKVKPEQRSGWQQLAAQTHGVLTPANLISILGATLVGIGLFAIMNNQLAWGTLAVFLGRCADVLDGWVAERTGTKGPVGEAIDAAIDKIVIAAALIVLLAYELLPLAVGILMAWHTVYNILLAVLAQLRSISLHPSRAGKLSVAWEWLAVGLFLSSAAAQGTSSVLAFLLVVGAWLSFASFMALGAYSSLGYSVRLMRGAS